MIDLNDIVGQDRAVRILTRMLERGRVPHALLFTGIDGSGRQTTAQAFAMAMNCRESEPATVCARCRSCRQMLSGNHPDLILVSPSGMAIKIDQIRDLRRCLRFAPIEGGYRMIIVNDAQAMNPEASNALLKTLEEPPKDTHIVLTAPETGGLLETIVSRCQHVAFRPIPAETIAAVLQEKRGMDQDTARGIAMLTHGSLGSALSCDGEQWMAWRKDVIKPFLSFSKASIPALFAFAEHLARDKDRLQDALDMVNLWFRDVLIWQFCHDDILNKDYRGEIDREAETSTAGDLLRKIETVTKTKEKISRNVNRRLALEVMMLQLKGVGETGPGAQALA